jgi:uncharacterized protein YbaP (TraB family)
MLAAGLLLLAAAAAAAQPFTEGRLWRVSRAGIPDSFVFGTIHIPDERVSRIAPPVADALDRSRTLALEVAPLANDTDELRALEQLDGNARLEPLLGSAAYAKLRSQLLSQGMTDDAIARLKPWAAMLRVSQAGAQPNGRSLDENLLLAARERRLRILPLELVEEQISAFDTVPMESQVALLDHVLAHPETLSAGSEATIVAWLRGDLAGLVRASQRAGEASPAMRRHYQALARHVVYDRTVLIHHRLFMAMRAGRVFVAVGASHLPGDNGLLALLRRDGYRVTRLW